MKGDPFSGFWTLVPGESKLAGPMPRRWTETLDVGDEAISVKEEITGADGRTLVVTVDGAFDGRDSRVNGSPLADVIAYTRPGSHRIDGVAKKDGRVVLTESITVSEGLCDASAGRSRRDQRRRVQATALPGWPRLST
jgi:hypothetical protein